jgi:hypothetical protein
MGVLWVFKTMMVLVAHDNVMTKENATMAN